VKVVEHSNGSWNTMHVDVLDGNGRVIAGYDRNHPGPYQAFEPFRQGDRILAPLSTDHTATSVMDLATGKIIAAEHPSAVGFCPTGFYVPDWWDTNDGSILPGATHWRKEAELPSGDFCFVWGCAWGDEASWKVQYLDLSHVQEAGSSAMIDSDMSNLRAIRHSSPKISSIAHSTQARLPSHAPSLLNSISPMGNVYSMNSTPARLL
jgi:hypothetical protein